MRFTETIWMAEDTSIDEAAGVIRGVKIIGTSSRNGRTYPPDVLRKAAPLYEGAMVNMNHREPGSGKGARVAEDRFGTLSAVSYREGKSPGLYGDMHYFKSHDMAGRVAEAQRRPELRNTFGLSHDADGEGRQTGGGFLVEKITKVHSVDVVSDPATNRSFFESVQLRTIRLSELVANLPADSKAKALMKQKMDQKVLDPNTEIEADPNQDPAADPEQAPEEAVDAAFRAEVVKAFDDEALDSAGRSSRIDGILKAHDEVKDTMAKAANNGQANNGNPADAGGSNGTPPAQEPQGKESQKVGESLNSDPTLASLQEEVRQLRAKDECRELLEETGRKSTPRLLKALIGMANNEDRKAFLEELGQVQEEKGHERVGAPKPKPRTTGQNTPPPNGDKDKCPTGKAIRESLMMDESLLELEESFK